MKEYLMKIQVLHNYEIIIIFIICVVVGFFFGQFKNK
jgi:hypothetical protein